MTVVLRSTGHSFFSGTPALTQRRMKVPVSLDAGDYVSRLNTKPWSSTCEKLSQSIGLPSKRRWGKLAAGYVIRDDRGRAVCLMKPVRWQGDTSLPQNMGGAGEHCHDHSLCGRAVSDRRQAVTDGFMSQGDGGFSAPGERGMIRALANPEPLIIRTLQSHMRAIASKRR